MAEQLARGEVFLRGRGARMLSVDEHCRLIWRRDDTGDLLALRAGQEAPDLTRLGIGGQHLVVAKHREPALVLNALTYVGLDPQPRVGITSDAVCHMLETERTFRDSNQCRSFSVALKLRSEVSVSMGQAWVQTWEPAEPPTTDNSDKSCRIHALFLFQAR
mgnify:FL=1